MRVIIKIEIPDDVFAIKSFQNLWSLMMSCEILIGIWVLKDDQSSFGIFLYSLEKSGIKGDTGNHKVQSCAFINFERVVYRVLFFSLRFKNNLAFHKVILAFVLLFQFTLIQLLCAISSDRFPVSCEVLSYFLKYNVTHFNSFCLLLYFIHDTSSRLCTGFTPKRPYILWQIFVLTA